MEIHQKYMRRCLQLAANGLGTTYPNPMVGSVVVVDGQIIGEGWHQRSGEAHAEVRAIKAVQDGELLKKASLYVSLEPCSHYGKTPPCSDLIITSGIKKVYIGCVDPYSEVAGRGIAKLRRAGCEVRVGILERDCRLLNRRFFTFHLKKRPYIILKWAQTVDGFLSPTNRKQLREPVWITNAYSKQLVHKWRAQEASILVGTNTAIADNPRLDVRLWSGHHPVRLVLDRQLRIPETSYVFDKRSKTLVFCEEPPSLDRGSDHLNFETLKFGPDLPARICNVLYQHSLQSVIVEGGSQTLQSFIEMDLWDEARVFQGKKSFGKGIPAPVIKGKVKERVLVDTDILTFFEHD